MLIRAEPEHHNKADQRGDFNLTGLPAEHGSAPVESEEPAGRSYYAEGDLEIRRGGRHESSESLTTEESGTAAERPKTFSQCPGLEAVSLR
jgi:hypothetical protein